MLIRDIKLQLWALIVVNLVVSVIIGGLGYMKLKENEEAVTQILTSNFDPVIQIADFRHKDAVFNEYVLVTLLEQNFRAKALLRRLRHDMERSWRMYYASGVSSSAETVIANKIDKILPEYLNSLDRLMLLLESNNFAEATAVFSGEVQSKRSLIEQNSRLLYVENSRQSALRSLGLSHSVDISLAVFSGFCIVGVGFSLIVAMLVFHTIWKYLRQIRQLANDVARERLGDQQVGDEIAQVDRLLMLARQIR
ncbi:MULTISPECIES: MCP four helix bundle domain-containing protein [unclassified Herbaspirillum]|uniref:MCP four helix bundle domain-containing protein n=1 Tax=unclassified Herbaspirillum TaxID=2624150 RepID=UPI0011511FAF|nr:MULTISPECIES: MCP four helix bundle domain-containing protein [unclassified Herbaspirillum]MBB5390556.1 hypothetical protein [Herbaspirillum sp. SJZ102]TQK08956.1 chemoreceptor-like protein with four helix bundle sensory module [Herbaspirillum sp. SJZ130]TQK14357.1 chemoreceptor-like protein with four helix bundle sensory module [Herbaspirillum sp. SJZ106]TWC66626.1 chemoreceptor-like protein with four helix bundle sensory module [Herbaspirillum sp. SJZ099]